MTNGNIVEEVCLDSWVCRTCRDVDYERRIFDVF